MSNYELGYQHGKASMPSEPPFGDTARAEYNDGYMAAVFEILEQTLEELTA